MKFRNPETGEVFEEIWPLLNLYCISHSCENCSLPLNCARYCIDFPEEAARLMGFEVVEETIKTVPGHEPLTAAQQKDMAEFIDSTLAEKEEANMGKPRVAQVLGVEVGEVFTADTPYGQFKRCVVDEEGQILNTGINVLCYIINHPDRIIRKPRWTEQEVEDAKAIKRVLKATGIRRNRYDNIYATGELIVDTLLDSEAFPSLQPDTAVTIDEIIGGAQ